MKVTLRKFELMLDGELPAEQQTIYKWSSKKIVDWIDRINPAGRRDRELWIDVEKYNDWAIPRGRKTISEGRAAN